MEPEVDLDGKAVSNRSVLESKICKKCFAVYRGKDCPNCGAKEEAVKVEITEDEGELTEVLVTSKTPAEQWLEYLIDRRKKTNSKPGWEFWKLIEKYPYESVKHLMPPYFIKRYESKQEDDPFYGSPFQGGTR